MMSPCRVTSSRSSVRIGDLAWQEAARNEVKSCRPSKALGGCVHRVASSGAGTCQTRPASSAGRLRRLRMRKR